MYKITQTQKVLWQLYCKFSWIPREKYLYSYPAWDGGTKFDTVHYRTSPKQWDFLHSAYHECTQVLKIVDEPFEQFANWFLNGIGNPYTKRGRYGWGIYRRRWWRRNYSKPSKYRHQFYHKKKELNEEQLAKKEWREQKFAKDKRKPYWHNGRKTFAKRTANKARRHYVKQNLQSGNWDFQDHKDMFSDPWDFY